MVLALLDLRSTSHPENLHTFPSQREKDAESGLMDYGTRAWREARPELGPAAPSDSVAPIRLLSLYMTGERNEGVVKVQYVLRF